MRPFGGLDPVVVLVNALTLSRLPVGILASIVYSTGVMKEYLAIMIGYLLVADLLDGALARRYGVTTRVGGILDYVIDRFNIYLMICLLIRSGISPFLFIPFLLRDLVYVCVQVYITMPSIRGTKAASFVGTASVYMYLLAINYWDLRTPALDTILVLTLGCSLINLAVRVFRLRQRLLAELKADLIL